MAANGKKNNSQPGFLRFLISKVFWLNVLIAVVIFTVLLWLTLLYLQQYSRHGESQTVPDLTGLTVTEAMEKVYRLDLDIAVMDSTFDPSKRPLSILGQDPVPNAKVKSGRKIYITVNMATPPETELPHIEIGTSYISVREILESHGLRVGDIIYKPFEYKDVFLDMKLHGSGKSLKPGTKITKGSKVDLVLGNGLGDTRISIPDLRGLTYLEAVSLIQLKELSVGTVIATGTITDTLEAFVYKQVPAADADRTVNLGSMVDIWITQDRKFAGEEEEPADEPNVP
jgi:beta-lactam-binding protein with PASTA domain